MQEDITELVKRVSIIADGFQGVEYDNKHNAFVKHKGGFAWNVSLQPLSELLEAAPQLAQAVLELQKENLQMRLDRTDEYRKAYQHYMQDEGPRYQAAIDRRNKEIEQLKAEIAALRPDAQAWREREARYQAEKQELEKRMGK